MLQNNVTDHVELECVFLCDKTGTLSLITDKKNIITVPVSTLKKVVDARKINYADIDVVKINARGEEFDVIRGGAHMWKSIKDVIIHFAPEALKKAGENPVQMLYYITNYEYQCYYMEKKTKKGVEEWPNDQDCISFEEFHAVVKNSNTNVWCSK